MMDSSLRCSECQQQEVSLPSLRAHVSTKHCAYLPYECYLCTDSIPRRSTFEPTEETMKQHILHVHQSNQLRYLLNVDEHKRNRLELIIRSSMGEHRPGSRSSYVPSPPAPSSNQSNITVPILAPVATSSPQVGTGNQALAGAEQNCNVCLSSEGLSLSYSSPLERRAHVIDHLSAKLGQPFNYYDEETKSQYTSLFVECFSCPLTDMETNLSAQSLAGTASDGKDDSTNLEKQLAKVTTEKPENRKCNICLKTIDSDQTTHILSAHLRHLQLFKCPYCKQTSNSENVIRRHVKSSHPDETFEIKDNSVEHEQELKAQIEKCFGKKRKFAVAKKSVPKVKKAKVVKLPAKSEENTASDAQIPEEQPPTNSNKPKQSKDTPSTCPDCGKVYSSAGNLARHRTQAHKNKKPIENSDKSPKGSEVPNFHCQICSKDFRSDRILKEHESHCGTKRQAHSRAVEKIKESDSASAKFRCEVCNKLLASQSSFTRHKALHQLTTSPRNYKCTCGKSYKDRKELYKHKKRCPGCNDAVGKRRRRKSNKINAGAKTSAPIVPQATPAAVEQDSSSRAKDFKCRKCSSVFKDMPSLLSHSHVCKDSVTPTPPTFEPQNLETAPTEEELPQPSLWQNLARSEFDQSPDNRRVDRSLEDIKQEPMDDEVTLIDIKPPPIIVQDPNFYTCAVCTERIPVTEIQGRLNHVHKVHVKKPLYVCIICNNYHSWCSADVKTHARNEHPLQNAETAVQDNTRMYLREIAQWNARCFAHSVRR